MPDEEGDLYEVEFATVVIMRVKDPSIVQRVLENWGDDNTPKPRIPYTTPWEPGQDRGWKDSLYDLDEEGVAEMLALSCGIWSERISNLDGWADLPNDDGLQIVSVDHDLRWVTKNGETV